MKINKVRVKQMKHIWWSLKYYTRYGIRQWWRWRLWNKYHQLQRKLFPKERFNMLFDKEGEVVLVLQVHSSSEPSRQSRSKK